MLFKMIFNQFGINISILAIEEQIYKKDLLRFI